MGIREIPVVTCDVCKHTFQDPAKYIDYSYAGLAFCMTCIEKQMSLREAIYILLEGENIFYIDKDKGKDRELYAKEFKHVPPNYRGF